MIYHSLEYFKECCSRDWIRWDEYIILCVKDLTRRPVNNIGDAGCDLIVDSVETTAEGVMFVGTGIKSYFPLGVHAEIRPRSGLALKHGITIINSPGTIDPSYRGEWKIIFWRHFGDFQFEPGMKCAQAVFSCYFAPGIEHKQVPGLVIINNEEDYNNWDQLIPSYRGGKGFGHSGF